MEPGPRPVKTVIQEVGQGVKEAVASELNLAKVEMRAAARSLGRQGAKAAVGAGILAAGGLALLAFLVVGFGELIGNFWLSALIIGALFAGIGGALLASAASSAKKKGLSLPRLQKSIDAQKSTVQEKFAEVTEIAQRRRIHERGPDRR